MWLHFFQVPDTKVESHLENASPCLVLFDSAALADVSYATSASFNSDDSAMLGTEVLLHEPVYSTLEPPLSTLKR